MGKVGQKTRYQGLLQRSWTLQHPSNEGVCRIAHRKAGDAMKLSVAGSRLVEDIDLSDTQDVSPRYADVVHIYQAGDESADSVADAWLDHMWRDA